MGIAVLSGTLASLQSNSSIPRQKWENHTSGTTTPTQSSDPSLPSRFLACVNREDSIKRLQKQFCTLGAMGETVEIFAHRNIEAVKQADVVLLWCVLFWERPSDSECNVSCKPQQAFSILGEAGMREALEDKLLISILAGVTIAQLKALVHPMTKIIRAMPNTPCRVSFIVGYIYKLLDLM